MSADDTRTLALWDLADLVTPMTVRLAATHRFGDHIAAGRDTAAAIAAAEHLDASSVERLLRHLVTVGVLGADGERYVLTGLGEGLRSDHPSMQRHLIDTNGAIGRGDLGIVELGHTLRTGEPSYPVRYGLGYWDDLASDRELAESFDAVVADNVSRDAKDIAHAYDWSALGHVYDLGGGNGALLAGLLTAHPTLRGTVVDLPGTTDRARSHFAREGLADRACALDGSFFDPLPVADGGGYVLSSVLHNWGDAEAVGILRRCAEALAGCPDGPGRVLVIEETCAHVHTGMDIRMLAYFGGVERSVAGITDLARRAGLTVAGVYETSGQATPVRSVIELVLDGQMR
ncbi:methyltransferase [Streptomyces bambusae]|uniref:methyltransferase n=1 Tax=Streptomyces bambusae TaxID=1550616 RepID=UPI001CFFD123|nr:methyltransferase [Streptomyces bambusae]MCB5169602.1 methyltransferase [Streptomyces bambusae]